MQGQARWEWGRWSWPECRGGKNPEEPRPRQYPGDLQDRVQTYYCVNMPLNSKSGDSQNVPEYIWVYRKSQYVLFSPTWGAVRDIRILEKSKDSLMWWLITEETKGEMWQIILMQRWKRKEKKKSLTCIFWFECARCKPGQNWSRAPGLGVAPESMFSASCQFMCVNWLP